jgi:hypothetical protein
MVLLLRLRNEIERFSGNGVSSVGMGGLLAAEEAAPARSIELELGGGDLHGTGDVR